MNKPHLPFIASIATEGEYSFLFVDGEFSHALIKRARQGDYRIQEAYGGTSQAIDPTEADKTTARNVLTALDSPPLYARVDMIRLPGGALAGSLAIDQHGPGAALPFAAPRRRAIPRRDGRQHLPLRRL